MADDRRWRYVRRLVNDGATLKVNVGDSASIASLLIDEQVVCMFPCGGMDFDAIMDHLDELAGRYEESSIVTDEINGQSFSVD